MDDIKHDGPQTDSSHIRMFTNEPFEIHSALMYRTRFIGPANSEDCKICTIGIYAFFNIRIYTKSVINYQERLNDDRITNLYFRLPISR